MLLVAHICGISTRSRNFQVCLKRTFIQQGLQDHTAAIALLHGTKHHRMQMYWTPVENITCSYIVTVYTR